MRDDLFSFLYFSFAIRKKPKTNIIKTNKYSWSNFRRSQILLLLPLAHSIFSTLRVALSNCFSLRLSLLADQLLSNSGVISDQMCLAKILAMTRKKLVLSLLRQYGNIGAYGKKGKKAENRFSALLPANKKVYGHPKPYYDQL